MSRRVAALSPTAAAEFDGSTPHAHRRAERVKGAAAVADAEEPRVASALMRLAQPEFEQHFVEPFRKVCCGEPWRERER
jgi:hypothetical protein